MKEEQTINTAQLFLIPAALLLLYSSFLVLFKKERRFRSRAYAEEEESALKKASKHMETAARKRVKLSEKKEKELQTLLTRVGWKDTPEDIATQQVVYGSIGLFAGIFAALLFKYFYLFIAAPIIAVIFYRYPIFVLKGEMKKRLRKIQYAFPDFIDLFVLLNSAGLTPYQAIKKVAENAPADMRLEVQRLSSDMDALTYEQALENFSGSLGFSAAKRFVFALKQAMEMSPGEAQEIFKTQSKFVRDLRVQNMRAVIKEKPGKVQMITMGVFLFLMGIPFVLFVLSFTQSYSNM